MVLDGVKKQIVNGTIADGLNCTGSEFTNFNKFKNNKDQQLEFNNKGLVIDNDAGYCVEKIDLSNKNYNALIQQKQHIQDIISGKIDNASEEDQATASFYVASQKNDKQFSQNLINNAAESKSYGSLAYVRPSTARMLGAQVFKQESERGTRWGEKLYGLDDYINYVQLQGYDWATEIMYILERNPNQILSSSDLKAMFSDVGSVPEPYPADINYDKDIEVRGIKTRLISATLHENLLQSQALDLMTGLKQRELKENYILNWFNDVIYYGGMQSMFTNNNCFTTEKATNNSSTSNIDSQSLIVKLGMADVDGTVKFQIKDLPNQETAIINNFVTQLSLYIRFRYGNNTFRNAIMMVSTEAFATLNLPMLPYYKNMSMLAGVVTLKDYIEKYCNVTIVPCNLCDGNNAGVFQSLNLAQEDTDVFYLYDKAQYFMFETSPFTAISGWNTANGVDFTTVYAGQVTDVYNPYYKSELKEHNIPAVKAVLSTKK